MNNVVKNFENIKNSINNNNAKIIAISKTFSYEKIKPLVDYGHNHFGENKVQEAYFKWSNVKKSTSSIKLHMVGKLQSNKARLAVELFDYIHSLDSEKLAKEIVKYEKLLNKHNKYFIQVNIGNEKQKAGILVEELETFYNFCKNISLNVVGLMCIPPNDNNAKKYFVELYKLNNFLKLGQISMGMSADYKVAVKCGSTFVRIGSAIFGDRLVK